MAGFLDDVFDKIGSYENNTGFKRGTWPVKILLAEDEEDSKGRDIIRVSVEGANGELGEATLWMHSEGGAKMAVSKVGGLIIHNSDESKKDSIRESMKKLFAKASEMNDLKLTKKVLMKIISEKLIGKEGFAVSDPQGKYSTTKYVDLWHYEYQLEDGDGVDKKADATPVETAEEIIASGKDVTDDDDIEIPEDF
jgi:hypothetical protein